MSRPGLAARIGARIAPTDRAFRRWAWGVYAYLLFVIIGGSIVRITGSGAGCGQHWPTCHGEIVPTDPTLETIIEFSHRLTSGLSIWAVIALLLAAIARLERGTLPRRAAWLTFVFILIEALIGAGIVLLEYVADNPSYARAGWMAIHLINSFLLAAAAIGTLWGAYRPNAPIRWLPDGADRKVLLATIAITFLLGVTGAVAALGHTLFPVDPAATPIEHVLDDPWADTPYPMLVRMVHPALAVLLSLFYGWVCLRFHEPTRTHRERIAARWFAASIGLQLAGGFVNIWLSAPGALQVFHLATAHLMWAALVLVALETAHAEQGSVRS